MAISNPVKVLNPINLGSRNRDEKLEGEITSSVNASGKLIIDTGFSNPAVKDGFAVLMAQIVSQGAVDNSGDGHGIDFKISSATNEDGDENVKLHYKGTYKSVKAKDTNAVDSAEMTFTATNEEKWNGLKIEIALDTEAGAEYDDGTLTITLVSATEYDIATIQSLINAVEDEDGFDFSELILSGTDGKTGAEWDAADDFELAGAVFVANFVEGDELLENEVLDVKGFTMPVNCQRWIVVDAITSDAKHAEVQGKKFDFRVLRNLHGAV